MSTELEVWRHMLSYSVFHILLAWSSGVEQYFPIIGLERKQSNLILFGESK